MIRALRLTPNELDTLIASVRTRAEQMREARDAGALRELPPALVENSLHELDWLRARLTSELDAHFEEGSLIRMTGQPVMHGYFRIPEGCARLQFSAATVVKLTHLLAWGTKPESRLKQLSVHGRPQLMHPAPLGVFEPQSIRVDDIRRMGSLFEFLDDEGPVFFHLTRLSEKDATNIRCAAREIDIAETVPGDGVSFDIEGPVTELAVFGYEAS